MAGPPTTNLGEWGEAFIERLVTRGVYLPTSGCPLVSAFTGIAIADLFTACGWRSVASRFADPGGDAGTGSDPCSSGKYHLRGQCLYLAQH